MDDDLLRKLDWVLEAEGEDDARTLLSEAVDQNRAGKVEEALDTVERALREAEVEVVADDTVLAALLILRAVLLAKLERIDEAIVVCEPLRELTGDRDGFLRVLDGHSRNLYALLLAERGERTDAVQYLTGVVEDFADDEDPRFRVIAADAQGYRIRQLIELDQTEGAVTQWNVFLAGSGDDAEATVITAVAGAGADAATLLLIKARVSDGLSIAGDVIDRFQSRPEADIRASVALAMCCRWSAYRRRARLFAYWRSFQDFLAFLGDDPEPEVVEAIREAYPPKKAEKILRAARVVNG